MAERPERQRAEPGGAEPERRGRAARARRSCAHGCRRDARAAAAAARGPAPSRRRCARSRTRPRRSPRRRSPSTRSASAARLPASHRSRKRLVLQLAAEQRADARAGEAERMAREAVEFENEHVAERLADRARLDLAALRRGPCSAPRGPIAEQLAARSLFHSRPPRPRRPGSAPPAVPVQDSAGGRAMRRGRMSRACAAASCRRGDSRRALRLGLSAQSRWQGAARAASVGGDPHGAPTAPERRAQLSGRRGDVTG